MSSLCPNEVEGDWTNTTRAPPFSLRIHDPIKVIWSHFQSKYDQIYLRHWHWEVLFELQHCEKKLCKWTCVWSCDKKNDRQWFPFKSLWLRFFCSLLYNWGFTLCLSSTPPPPLSLCVTCVNVYESWSFQPTLTNKHMLIMEEITGRSPSTLPLKRSRMHYWRAYPGLGLNITRSNSTAPPSVSSPAPSLSSLSNFSPFLLFH